ncbi:putative response regulatory protein [compost metagenome]
MIVDDEAILRTGMLHLCNWSEYGIEIVAQAANGQEALQQMKAVQPHVVITDIVMPVMDGVEFTKEMRSQHPDIKIVVLSSYSEFNYVREVFKYGVTDYLLKPKISAAELISLIQALCSNIDLTSHSNLPVKKDPALMLGQWLDSDAALDGKEDASLELHQHFKLEHFIIAKASTNLLLSRTKWTQSQIENIIIDLASEHLLGLEYCCVFLKNEALLLVNYGSSQSVEVIAALKRFAEHTKEALNFISFVLSHTFDQFSSVKSEHEKLTAHLGRLLYFTEQALVPENEMMISGEKTNFDELQFTSTLRTFSIDEAISMLKALFSEIQYNRSYDEYSLKRLCQNLIYTTISTLEQLKQPVTELGSSKLKLFKMIDLAFDIRELESILIQFLEQVKSIVQRNDYQQSMILHQVYEYVNKNYANEISLSEMANSLHLNYTYLSSYFKQRTGENLTSYISRVRTDKAKELLLDQALSVSEISRITGFSDHNYFSKVFKKMTGMTPIEYRHQISQ